MHKDKFSSRDDIYFLNHSVGCLPADTSQVIEQKFLAPWQQAEQGPWPQWLAAIDDFNQAMASLLNSKASYFCPQANVSQALTKLLFALPENHKKTILLTEHDFPTIGYVVQKFAQKMGYKVRYIPKKADITDLNIWDQYLDGDVFTVLITHAYSNLGCQPPVSDIIGLSRQRDIFTVVDVAQSAGVLPINLSEWDADFVIGSCVKWLCGGPGAGYLWVNPKRLQQCEPVDVGWFSHADPFEFDLHDFRYHDSALRFWGGSPSVVPYVLAANSINLLAGVGVENIRQHNQMLMQKIIDKLDGSVLVSPVEPLHRSGTLVVNFAERQQSAMDKLHQAKIRFDERQTGLRLSPHIYNTEGEVETLLKCF